MLLTVVWHMLKNHRNIMTSFLRWPARHLALNAITAMIINIFTMSMEINFLIIHINMVHLAFQVIVASWHPRSWMVSSWHILIGGSLSSKVSWSLRQIQDPSILETNVKISKLHLWEGKPPLPSSQTPHHSNRSWPFSEIWEVLELTPGPSGPTDIICIVCAQYCSAIINVE